MRARYNYLLTFICAITIAACSSDNGTAPADDADGDGGGGKPTVVDTLRLQTLDDIAQQLDSWWDEGPDTVAVRAIAYLNTIPVFEEVGRSGTTGVWARFEDGRLLIIPNNLEPGAPEDTLTLLDGEAPVAIAAPRTGRQRVIGTGREALRSASVPTQGLEIPGSTQFRVWDGTAGCYLTPRHRVRALLRDNGYVEAPSSSPTVDGFKHVRGDGVFVIFSHGGSGDLADKSKTYAIWTSTNVALPMEAEYLPLWNNFELAYMMMRGRDAAGGCSTVTNYGVTAPFVARYMRFTDNSLVYLNVCDSGTAPAADIRQAFANAGASVVIGWDGLLTVGFTFKTLPFFLDRLLGANDVDPKESPEQRAFNVYDVRDNMAARGRVVDPSGRGEFKIFKLGDDFGLLAPSIQFLSLEEYIDRSELIIAGMFGTDPGGDNRAVKINGQPLDVISWENNLIRCELPISGQNAAGTVVVEVGSGVHPRVSNAVNLTEWKGELTYERDDPGSQRVDMKLKVHFRADIHSFRDKPGEQPYETTVLFNHMGDTSAEITVGGSYQESMGDCTDTYTFTQGVSLPSPFESTPNGGWTYLGAVDSQKHVLQLNMSVFTLFDGSTWVHSGPMECNPFTLPTWLSVKIEECLFDEVYTGNLTAFYMQMDTAFEVSADNRNPCTVAPLVAPLVQHHAEASIRWDAMTPNSPPDPDAAR